MMGGKKKAKEKLVGELTFIRPTNALLGLLAINSNNKDGNLQPQKAGVQMPSLPSEVAHAPGSLVTAKGVFFFKICWPFEA